MIAASNVCRVKANEAFARRPGEPRTDIGRTRSLRFPARGVSTDTSYGTAGGTHEEQHTQHGDRYRCTRVSHPRPAAGLCAAAIESVESARRRQRTRQTLGSGSHVGAHAGAVHTWRTRPVDHRPGRRWRIRDRVRSRTRAECGLRLQSDVFGVRVARHREAAHHRLRPSRRAISDYRTSRSEAVSTCIRAIRTPFRTSPPASDAVRSARTSPTRRPATTATSP